MVTTLARKCEICGYEGSDVHYYPTYSPELKRDTTQLQCDNYETCLDRKYGNTPAN